MNFRHELKHVLSYADFLAIRPRLSAVIQSDEHTINGIYEIRSLYFDNLSDKALREKLDGVNCREKFRIRYYNGDRSFILLEKKTKQNGLCSKVQAVLNDEEILAVANETYDTLQKSNTPLVQELYRKISTQGLAPKTIVDYKRIPFVYAPGNVRVTLDYDIRTALHCTDFLNPDCITIKAGDAPIILEVKWDAFLPALIRDIVQVPSTHTTAFSKYAACRIYG